MSTKIVCRFDQLGGFEILDPQWLAAVAGGAVQPASRDPSGQIDIRCGNHHCPKNLTCAPNRLCVNDVCGTNLSCG